MLDAGCGGACMVESSIRLRLEEDSMNDLSRPGRIAAAVIAVKIDITAADGAE